MRCIFLASGLLTIHCNDIVNEGWQHFLQDAENTIFQGHG
jgi:hypothetical protein